MVLIFGSGPRHRLVQLRKLYEDEEPPEEIEDHLCDDECEGNSDQVQPWDYLPVNMWVLLGISFCTICPWNLYLESCFQLCFFDVFSGFLGMPAFTNKVTSEGLYTLPICMFAVQTFSVGQCLL